MVKEELQTGLQVAKNKNYKSKVKLQNIEVLPFYIILKNENERDVLIW